MYEPSQTRTPIGAKIPRQCTIENRARASRVAEIETKYFKSQVSDRKEDFVTDLLTDLRHYCDVNSIAFGDQDHLAHGHYLAELAGLAASRQAKEDSMKKTVIAAILLIQMAVCAVAQNASPPQKPPAVMTLWGVTLGAAAPRWPKCPGRWTAEGDPACVDSVGEVNNLIPNYPATVSLTLGADDRVQGFFTEFGVFACHDVLPALNAKFGDAVDELVPLQNGYGARWDGHIYTWRTGDGSELSLLVGISKMRDCHLLAETADVVRERNARTVPTP